MSGRPILPVEAVNQPDKATISFLVMHMDQGTKRCKYKLYNILFKEIHLNMDEFFDNECNVLQYKFLFEFIFEYVLMFTWHRVMSLEAENGRQKKHT